MTSPFGSLSDGRVQIPRAADLVAERIRELIVTGQLADGERLPSLEGLPRRIRDQRATTMREALRMLESEGLITVQRGKVGGAIVHRPSYTDAASTWRWCCGAATRRSPTSLAHSPCWSGSARVFAPEARTGRMSWSQPARVERRARSLVQADEVTFAEAMTAFHEELMRGCGLETLALATRAVGAIWLVCVREWAAENGAQGRFVTHEERVAWLRRQDQLIAMIEAGDEAEVEAMMTEHFSTMQILGDGLDPQQMIDTRAVRANRVMTREREAGSTLDRLSPFPTAR